MKYIDSEKLLAEIERRREKCAEIAERSEEVAEYYHGKEVAYDETSTLVTSLQHEQPDVDLEKEIYKLYDGEYHDTEDVARHFYELGLNARKEGAK